MKAAFIFKTVFGLVVISKIIVCHRILEKVAWSFFSSLANCIYFQSSPFLRYYPLSTSTSSIRTHVVGVVEMFDRCYQRMRESKIYFEEFKEESFFSMLVQVYLQ